MRIPAAVLALLTVLSAVLAACSTAGAPPAPVPLRIDYRPGPTDDSFYSGAPSSGDTRVGSLIWARPAPAPQGVSGYTILYWSRSAAGAPVPVSASLYAPATTQGGASPPIVAWAHGTTGLGDPCAPTKEPEQISGPDSRLVSDTVRAGRVFVATDYEGLGTPGDHPYIASRAAGQDVLDAIRAAAGMTGWTSRPRAAVLGTSQGGAAALFASAEAPTYAPDIDLRAVVAIAPPANLTALIPALNRGPYAGYLTMSLAGMYTAYPDLLGTEKLLTPEGRSMIESARHSCVDEFLQSQAGKDASALGVVRVLEDPAVVARLEQNDPDDTILQVPTMVVQGDKDDTIPVDSTRGLVADLCRRGSTVVGEFVPDAGHVDVLYRDRPRLAAYVDERLADAPPPPPRCR